MRYEKIEEYEIYLNSNLRSSAIKPSPYNQRYSSSLTGVLPYNDIIICECGREQCRANKAQVDSDVKIHTISYVVSGQGIHITNGVSYKMKRGDIFATFPGEHISYYPVSDDPWNYIKISFKGMCADSLMTQIGITKEHIVIEADRNAEIQKLFILLHDTAITYGQASMHTLGSFYSVMANVAMLSSNQEKKRHFSVKEKHLIEAMNYIGDNCVDNISVKDVATSTTINSEYLTRIFKELLNMTIKEYITYKKMEIAKNWIMYTNTTIRRIGEYIGIADYKYFIRVYKKHFGHSPAKHRAVMNDIHGNV